MAGSLKDCRMEDHDVRPVLELSCLHLLYIYLDMQERLASSDTLTLDASLIQHKAANRSDRQTDRQSGFWLVNN